jgi:hypothetical protein
MSSDCVVTTGNHDQGFRALFAKDEVFVIVRSHQPLAQGHTTHVMDAYDHYRWRFTLQTTLIKDVRSTIRRQAWQEKFYAANRMARRESLMWTGHLPPAGRPCTQLC